MTEAVRERKIVVEIATLGDDKMEVRGYEVTPGLAVTPYSEVEADGKVIRRRGRWIITHRPSGKSLGGARPLEEARSMARQLAALGDWNKPARTVADLGIDEKRAKAILYPEKEEGSNG